MGIYVFENDYLIELIIKKNEIEILKKMSVFLKVNERKEEKIQVRSILFFCLKTLFNM